MCGVLYWTVFVLWFLAFKFSVPTCCAFAATISFYPMLSILIVFVWLVCASDKLSSGIVKLLWFGSFFRDIFVESFSSVRAGTSSGNSPFFRSPVARSSLWRFTSLVRNLSQLSNKQWDFTNHISFRLLAPPTREMFHMLLGCDEAGESMETMIRLC